MALAKHHSFQILTKRPERMRDFLESDPPPFSSRAEFIAGAAEGLTDANGCRVVIWDARGDDRTKYTRPISDEQLKIRRPWPGWPLPNVWLGVSAEDQKTFDERVPLLLQTPATVRFVSLEPLLGPINLFAMRDGSFHDSEGADWYNALAGHAYWSDPADGGLGGRPKLDQVIVGGESGPGARPMHPDWVRSIRDQCVEAGAPFLFKQRGEWTWGPVPKGAPRVDCPRVHYWSDDCHYSYRVGKKRAGRELDGKIWEEFPR